MTRLVFAILLALALVSTTAHAAQLQTSRACYLQDVREAAGKTEAVIPTISVEGSGLPGARPYSVILDGSPLVGGTGQTDDAGNMTGTFRPPALGDDEFEHEFQLAVSADDQTAATHFTVTRFLVDFSPSRGRPQNLRVRFSLFGFGLDERHPQPNVYVHWIDPRGRHRATALLGRAQGDCGSLPRTPLRRLFPFKNTLKGKWKLQFDLSKKFRRGRPDSDFLFYGLGVRVT